VRPRLGRGCDRRRREVEADTRAPRVSGCDNTRARGGYAGRAGPGTALGCARGRKIERPRGWAAAGPGWRAAAEKGEGEGLFLFFFFKFLFLFETNKQLNSNQDLDPNTQEQCNGMNATHTQLFIKFRKYQTKDFSYTIFPVKKIKAGQNFKI
jgi:hypothetical protein